MSAMSHQTTLDINDNASNVSSSTLTTLYPGEVPDHGTIDYSATNNNKRSTISSATQDANHKNAINQKHINDTAAVIDIDGDGKYTKNHPSHPIMQIRSISQCTNHYPERKYYDYKSQSNRIDLMVFTKYKR